MAIEYFVFICGSSDEVCEYVSTDIVFESIRKYARYGNQDIWVYNVRRIYSRNAAYKGDPRSSVNWEADFLFLGNGEVYFVIAMFGIEYVICLNRPEIKGYKDWLIENNEVSPLYVSEAIRKRNFEQYCETMYSDKEKTELKR